MIMSSQDQTNEQQQQTELRFEDTERETEASEASADPFQSSEEQPPQSSSNYNDTEHIKGQEELILTLTPADPSTGHISIRELTQTAGGLQYLADSIANTIYNQPSEKGKIPEDILENTNMTLSDIQPDAFKAVLTIRHPEQTSLEQPAVVAALQELFHLFEASHHNDRLAYKIAMLGPRTFRVYADWAKAMTELNIPVRIEWHSAYNDTTIAAFDTEKTAAIYQTLANFSTTNEDITVKGVFTGANIRTGAFEVITEEGEQISGTTSREAMTDFASVKFNRTYTVDLLKIRVSGPAVQEKTAWTLKSIAPA